MTIWKRAPENENAEASKRPIPAKSEKLTSALSVNPGENVINKAVWL
ncbi:hypothetical protein ACUXI4_004519 [Pantoea piersonii]